MRIALLGAGTIAPHHIESIASVGCGEVVAVCDLDASRRDELAQRLGCRGYGDYRGLLEHPPDVVVVCLPHALHAQAACDAMVAGCHVVVEKPMATTVADCRRMLAAARQLRRHLVVAESASANPGTRLTGQRYTAGSLGAFLTGGMTSARFYFVPERPRWFVDPQVSGGGMFANLGPHRLAVTRTALPGLEAVAVSASTIHLQRFPVEACTSVMVRYGGGEAMLYQQLGYHHKPEWVSLGTHFVFEEGLVAWDDITGGASTAPAG